MSKIAASIVAPVISSQIAAMSGKVPTASPVSTVARLIAAELKGGETKHNFVMSVITSAIEQAFKGNTRDIPEAVKLCQGKAIKAKAFFAGFHAIADMVTKITYEGKLDAAVNAPIRELIAQRTHVTACEFERAYLETFVIAKAQSLDKKAAKAAEAKSAPVLEVVASDAPVVETATVDAVVFDIGDSVAAVVKALDMGLLSADEIDAIAAALTLHSMAKIEQSEKLAA